MSAIESRAEREPGLGSGTIASNSMEPTLLTGDVVLFKRTPCGVKADDIAVLNQTVHRVLWIDPFRGIWHRGDRPGARVARAPRSALRGRVVAVIREDQWVEPGEGPQRDTSVPRLMGQVLVNTLWCRFKRGGGRT